MSRVSVIIPTFQRAHTLPRAIDSVLRQTMRELELVVVDDGSHDETPEVLGAYSDDPRVRVVRQDNRGVSAARNAGARASTAPIVTFLDSDDEADPQWLERLAAPLSAPDVGVACCALAIDNNNGRIFVRKEPGRVSALTGDVHALFLPGSYAVRREIFDEAGGFADELGQGENTELGIRLIDACVARGLRVATSTESLVVMHRDGIRKRHVQRQRSAEYMLSRYSERLERLPATRAMYASIASVNATRVGDAAAARRWAWVAVRVQPANGRLWIRLVGTLVPPLGRRVWLAKYRR